MRSVSFPFKYPARRHVFIMVICDVIASSEISIWVYGRIFRGRTVHYWAGIHIRSTHMTLRKQTWRRAGNLKAGKAETNRLVFKPVKELSTSNPKTSFTQTPITFFSLLHCASYDQSRSHLEKWEDPRLTSYPELHSSWPTVDKRSSSRVVFSRKISEPLAGYIGQ